ncbi:hypothetical protein [Psychroserpens jangbogonensis]|uniref:hypothetical protein n=1 Tax=Psychroserpens jangbogonensis TaxID=1484460 RepID=UPI00053E1C6F|nr:hypothetical protein [Psychroserpens jangbogonensis]
MQITYRVIFLALILSITSCKQVDPNKQIDEGKVENDFYSSKEIGWTMNIPSNWEVTSREQNEENQKKGLDVIEDMVDGEIDISGLKNLIGFQKNVFNMFQSTSEPFELEYEGEWEENNAGLKILIYETYLQQGIKTDSTATKIVKIDDLDFHTYTFTIYSPKDEVILNQIMYSRLINGFDFGVNINYNNESDKDEMLEVWLNSKFIKKKLIKKSHK